MTARDDDESGAACKRRGDVSVDAPGVVLQG